MERKIYITDHILSLAEYINNTDAAAAYDCWQDPDTQANYNYCMPDSFEQFRNRPMRSRFLAVILRNPDKAVLGTVSLSPENTLPDLAIMVYRPFRGLGYGTAAFSLALRYCFDTFDLPEIYAGCYEHNIRSLKMLKKCGFVPHPEGNQEEQHYLTGFPIIQYDFIKYREQTKNQELQARDS